MEGSRNWARTLGGGESWTEQRSPALGTSLHPQWFPQRSPQTLSPVWVPWLQNSLHKESWDLYWLCLPESSGQGRSIGVAWATELEPGFHHVGMWGGLQNKRTWESEEGEGAWLGLGCAGPGRFRRRPPRCLRVLSHHLPDPHIGVSRKVKKNWNIFQQLFSLIYNF